MKIFLLKHKTKTGSALALTMFIIAGMLVVAMSGSYIILLGIKAAGVQSQSTKAYFAAEAGSEKILWELRQRGWWSTENSTEETVFEGTLPLGSDYKVYYTHFNPIIFTSIGEFNKTKRSVELRM
ncbi:MAG: pilus assembly PilX N-terminal domain-containing protein [Patescibacteria group bacterium]